MQQERRWLHILYKIKDWLKNQIYTILYIILMILLSVYIISNWKVCISMQFFSNFDGNNILFLIWIILIFLFFYDVEAKGFKFHRRKTPAMEFQEAQAQYAQDLIDALRNDSLNRQTRENGSDGDEE